MKIFKFLNTASAAELQTVRGLSDKKSENIIKSRPYKSFAQARTLIQWGISFFIKFFHRLLKRKKMVDNFLKYIFLTANFEENLSNFDKKDSLT